MPSIRDKFLKESIDSILNQTMQEWELIFIDNAKCTRDGVCPIDSRIRIVDSVDWKGWGEGKSLNEAHKLAKSNIILYNADDDISMPERAEITYNRLTNTDIDIFYGSYIGIDVYSQPAFYFESKEFNPEIQRLKYNMLPLSSAGYRLDKVPAWREDIDALIDRSFWYDCHLKGLKFQHSPTPLSKYRVWNGSTSRSQVGRKQNAIKVLRESYNDPLWGSQRNVRYINFAKKESK